MPGEDGRPNAGAGVCHECGATGQIDVFCESCGAVLRDRALTAAAPHGGGQGAAFPLPGPGLGESRDGDTLDRTPVDPDASSEYEPGLPAQPADGKPSPFEILSQYEAEPAPSVPPAPASYDLAAAYAPPGSAPPYDPSAYAQPAQPLSYDPATAYAQPAQPAPYDPSAYAQPAQPAPYDPAAAYPPPGSPASSPAYEADASASTAPRDPYDSTALAPVQGAAPPAYPASPAPAPASPAPAGPTDVQARARELIVPVADRAVPEHGIVPVQPDMPQPARPTVRAPQAWDITGGMACPWCSTPNPVDRHYCRRCAMSLAARPNLGRPPWWRRMWVRVSRLRRREVPYAGQRPRLRRSMARAVRWVVAIAVVAVLGVEIDSHAGSTVLDVQDHFAKPVQAFTTTFNASHSDSSHQVKNLHDGYDNTWWGTGLQGDSAGVYAEATFAQPINLLDLIITPGAGVEQDTFTQESRPQVMNVTLFTSDGKSKQSTITLNDTPGPETFALRSDDVTKVRLTIESSYLADVPGQASEVAVSEVEFFVRAAHS